MSDEGCTGNLSSLHPKWHMTGSKKIRHVTGQWRLRLTAGTKNANYDSCNNNANHQPLPSFGKYQPGSISDRSSNTDASTGTSASTEDLTAAAIAVLVWKLPLNDDEGATDASGLSISQNQVFIARLNDWISSVVYLWILHGLIRSVFI
jgi:hypothetical protein